MGKSHSIKNIVSIIFFTFFVYLGDCRLFLFFSFIFDDLLLVFSHLHLTFHGWLYWFFYVLFVFYNFLYVLLLNCRFSFVVLKRVLLLLVINYLILFLYLFHFLIFFCCLNELQELSTKTVLLWELLHICELPKCLFFKFRHQVYLLLWPIPSNVLGRILCIYPFFYELRPRLEIK